jgi:hypothetical protein
VAVLGAVHWINDDGSSAARLSFDASCVAAALKTASVVSHPESRFNVSIVYGNPLVAGNENQSTSLVPPPDPSPSGSRKNVIGIAVLFAVTAFAAAWDSFGSNGSWKRWISTPVEKIDFIAAKFPFEIGDANHLSQKSSAVMKLLPGSAVITCHTSASAKASVSTGVSSCVGVKSSVVAVSVMSHSAVKTETSLVSPLQLYWLSVSTSNHVTT